MDCCIVENSNSKQPSKIRQSGKKGRIRKVSELISFIDDENAPLSKYKSIKTEKVNFFRKLNISKFCAILSFSLID